MVTRCRDSIAVVVENWASVVMLSLSFFHGMSFRSVWQEANISDLENFLSELAMAVCWCWVFDYMRSHRAERLVIGEGCVL